MYDEQEAFYGMARFIQRHPDPGSTPLEDAYGDFVDDLPGASRHLR